LSRKLFRKSVLGVTITLLLLAGIMMRTFNSSVRAPDGTSSYIYIRADGSVEPSDAPIGTTDYIHYKIYDDIINRSIIVERDGITLQGNNRLIQGDGSLKVGINLTGRTDILVENVRITRFQYGILLNSSTDCRLIYSTIWENWAGVWIESCLRAEIKFNNISYNNNYGIRIYLGGNNELYENTVWRNYYGINIWYSCADTLIGNNASLNFGTGILLYYSIGGTWLNRNNASSNRFFGISIVNSNDVRMNNNKASNNEHNFGIDGTSYADFTTHTIDTTNTVEGKPVYYIKGISDSIYNADINAGTIYLINCKNVTVRNLNLTKNGCGILLWNTTQSRIENISVSENVYGVRLEKSSNNTIILNNIVSNQYGIRVKDCNETRIIQNKVAENQFGLYMNNSMLSSISKNLISKNTADGIHLEYSSNNTITQNTIAENGELSPFPEPFFYGIKLQNSGNNAIYHNNFINNNGQAYAISSNDNKWDNGWPSGGNYWSDHNNVDINFDGIADETYVIDYPNVDAYPLVGMFSALEVPPYNIEIVCNSTVNSISYYPSNNTIAITVSNSTSTQTYGFCRLTIPHEVMAPPYNVTVDGKTVTYDTVFENESLSIIYFTYQHSTLEIIITPEHSSTITTLLLLMLILISAIITKNAKN